MEQPTVYSLNYWQHNQINELEEYVFHGATFLYVS